MLNYRAIKLYNECVDGQLRIIDDMKNYIELCKGYDIKPIKEALELIDLKPEYYDPT